MDYDRQAAKRWEKGSCLTTSSVFLKRFCNSGQSLCDLFFLWIIYRPALIMLRSSLLTGHSEDKNEEGSTDKSCYKVKHEALVTANDTQWNAEVWRYPSWTQGHKKLKSGEPADRMFKDKKAAKKYEKKFGVNETHRCYFDPKRPNLVAFRQHDRLIRKNFYVGIILLCIGLSPFAAVFLAVVIVTCVGPCLHYLQV